MTSRYESVFAKIESEAQSSGGVEAELFIESAERLAISFQMRKMYKYDSSQSHCAGVRVIEKGVAGYAFTENLSDDALLEAFRMARDNSRFVASGGASKMPIKLFRGPLETPELADLHNQSLASISMDQKMERARLLEASALDRDPRIQSTPYTQYSESEGEVEILSTSGIRRRQRTTSVGGYTYSIAKAGDESVQAFEHAFTRDATKFDPRKIAELSAANALEKLGASQPETGRYPVVIDSEAMNELLQAVAAYLSAREVDEKRSLFASELGQVVVSPLLTIVDDPFYRGGVGSRAFDGEGAACKATSLITAGVLNQFLTNSVYAEHMKLPMTASAARSARSELDIGISNLVVQPGASSIEELLGSSSRVIYVTEVTGFHAGFSSGTGDFSLQAEGELWENGRRSRPINNFVLSGNVRTLLKDVIGLSSRVADVKSSIIAPDFLIRELSIAGR